MGQTTGRGNFGSKIGVVLAVAGSAVGLGNVWRLPTEVGSNGGAAFILVYLACIALVGLPVMVSEFLIGRHTQANAITAFRRLAPGSWWRIGGVEGVFVAFLILSYYIIVSGWTLFYTISSLAGRLSSGTDYKAYFSDFVAHPWWPVLSFLAFMAMVHVVVVRGVQDGIEKSSKLMMPILLLIIGVLVVSSFSMSGFGEGLEFLLKPDFSRVTPRVVLSALGQAFFSLSLAMGCLCTYASYFGPNTNLTKTAFSVAAIDTSVAVLSGFIIFPAAFSVGVQPDAGPGLVFITLPSVFEMAFHRVPFVGYLFASLFYVLLLLAALTSAISLHESVTAYLHEEWRLSRRVAATWVSVACSLLGLLCALSMGAWGWLSVGGMNLFDFFDFLSAKLIMPLGGILIALFAGWRLDRCLLHDEVTNRGTLRVPLFGLYVFLVRWVAPLGIAAVFVHQLLAS